MVAQSGGRAAGKVVRDPVHDYVEIPNEIARLVACEQVQRLRNISQNSRAIAAYPSMNGSRYEHALGTMHLAREAWHYAWINSSGNGNESVQIEFMNEVFKELEELGAAGQLDEETARLIASQLSKKAEEARRTTILWTDFERIAGLVIGAVGLLHDLGHPPFSHVMEPFYQDRITDIFGKEAGSKLDAYRESVYGSPPQFHEWAGLEIFDKIDPAVFKDLPRSLIRLVLSNRTAKGWASGLHSIVDGQFDVDRLDYLMRDSQNAGTQYHNIDASRLLQSLELHPSGEAWKVGLGVRAVSAFETLLLLRAQSYRWVIHHQHVVAADAALVRCAALLYNFSNGTITGLPKDIQSRLKAELPNFNYIDQAPATDGRRGCFDDAGFITWIRTARNIIDAVTVEDPTVNRLLRAACALHDTFDTFTRTAIPAWRNYEELLERTANNRDSIDELDGYIGQTQFEPPGYAKGSTAAHVLEGLKNELPTKLGEILDMLDVQGQYGAHISGLEALADDAAPTVQGLGDGTWIIVNKSLKGVDEQEATVWRKDGEVPLTSVSPVPIGLAAIEIMRPRWFVYFLPHEAPSPELSKKERITVARTFFHLISERLMSADIQ